MTYYTVRYEVELEADTPDEAAQIAANVLTRDEPFPMHFDVWPAEKPIDKRHIEIISVSLPSHSNGAVDA